MAANAQESTDLLEALTGCDEHLQFAQEVINRSEIPEPAAKECRQHIERIKQRRADPNLYLAAIGEFSSGKSTFINALLRDDLLRTSALVATAAATRLRYGDALQVEVRLQGSRPGNVKTNPNSTNITIPWLPGVSGIDNRQFIRLVTANEEVAKDVVGVTVTHPAAFLANGIVIIDTPGTNATNPQHGAITRQVVENEADAAAIIIPATVPLSQTMTNFLAGSLRPYLHRCIFVVTRIDQIPPEEVSGLLTNLRSRLVAGLGIKPPMLYACAAQVMVDSLTGTEEIPPDSLVWKDRFSKLESVIINRLRQERTLSIAESLLRLLTRLFEQLETQLRDMWQQYETRQAAIQRETIPDLPSFAAEQHATCRQMLSDALSSSMAEIVQCVESQRETTVSQIQKAIFDAADEQSLKKFVETEAQSILNTGQQLLRQKLEESAEFLSGTGKEAELLFKHKFSDAYRRLQSITGFLEPDAEIETKMELNVADVFSSAESVSKELDSKDGNIAMGGMTAGAVIGNMILPGVGILIGGFLGGVAAVFFMSLDVRKQKIWENLRPSLDAYFESAKTQAQESVRTCERGVACALQQQIDAHVARYQAIVDAMLDEQKTELQRLNQWQESAQATISELERRQKSLSAQQERLAG